MNTLAILSGTHPIEKVTGERYIRRIFKKFQTEFIASNNCIHETLRKDNGNGCCRVGRVEEERRKQKVVHFASYNVVQVRCSCSMFETMGFLCQHSLYILKRKQVLEFPEHNIMDGWTSGVRFRTGDGGFRNSKTDAKMEIPSHLELWDLRAKVSRVTRTQRMVAMTLHYLVSFMTSSQSGCR